LAELYNGGVVQAVTFPISSTDEFLVYIFKYDRKYQAMKRFY